jgi:hypothetical protein
MSPTVFREGPYRGYFFSHETGEPPHIHVDRDDRSAKFWLEPVALAQNLGFKPNELREIEKLIVARREKCKEAWNEFFDT